MSLLRRIESARPASDLGAIPAPTASGAPALLPPPEPSAPTKLPAVTPTPVVQSSAGNAGVSTGRMLAQVPLRESFRDAKFRIQQRVIQDLDPKLDLSNQVEVRREIGG